MVYSCFYWYTNIFNLILDSVNQLHLSKLHAEYEKVCQDCLEKIEFIKVSWGLMPFKCFLAIFLFIAMLSIFVLFSLYCWLIKREVILFICLIVFLSLARNPWLMMGCVHQPEPNKWWIKKCSLWLGRDKKCLRITWKQWRLVQFLSIRIFQKKIVKSRNHQFWSQL